MGNEYKYRAKVLNVGGYVVMFPNVGDAVPKVTFPPNPYADSVTQLFPLGTKLIQGERVWRYCKNANNELAIAGFLQQATYVNAAQDDDIVVAVAADIGDYKVVVDSQAVLESAPLSTKNGIAEGYLIINDGTGNGQMYKIKAHEAFNHTHQTDIFLYDPLTIALVADNSDVGLIQNPYANVITATAVVSGMPIGVPLFVVTAKYYFWCQTGGPAPVRTQAAIALGTPACVGTTEGEVDPAATAGTGTTQLIVGYMMTLGVTQDDYAICFLILDR